MYRILLTGASGFVGNNLITYFKSQFKKAELLPVSIRYGDSISFKAQVYIHLAGKAHDTKHTIDASKYVESNYLLTREVYNAFLNDDTSECFIYMSSVKAIADKPGHNIVDENYLEEVGTIYGKSKKLAEDYILSNKINEKRVYILRPCMIHGPGNKGNLNLLYKLVSKGYPWPLGAFENQRSFCSIDNLMFIFKKLIEREDIPSGVYNVADDVRLSTNEVISIIAKSQNRKPLIWNISKGIIYFCAKIGNDHKLPLNEERLHKLTDSYIVSNEKLIFAIGQPLPLSSREGLLKTFQSFQE